MKPIVYSYTNPVTGTADTTINSGGSDFTCKILNMPIVTDGQPNFSRAGDGQEPVLTGVISQGLVLELQFTCGQTNVGDGYDLLAAMFNKFDRSEKTLTIRDDDDKVAGVGRAYYATCRNVGVGKPQKSAVIARVALKSEFLLTSLTTTESTWTNASSGSKTVTIDKGNVPALPVLSLSPSAANTNGNKYYRLVTCYNYTKKSAIAYHVEITGGGLDTSNIIFTAGTYFTINNGAGITAVATTIAYDNPAGSLPSIYPYNIYSAGEQMRVTARTGTTSGNLTVVRGVNGSTAATHSDNEQLVLSKMAYDGRDIRIIVEDGSGNGIETPYWFGGATGATGGMNTSATKIWIPYNVISRTIGTLSASISDTDTSLILTPSTVEAIFPPQNGSLLLDSEVATYDTYDVTTGTFTGLIRGTKGTTAASHTLGITVRAMNAILMYHGNGNAITAPSYSLALKPPFDLTSTNDAWTYSTFADNRINTADEWKPSPVVANGQSVYYGDASGSAPFVLPTPTNPVSDIGVSAIAAGEYGQWVVAVAFGCTSAATTTLKRLNLPANQAYLQGYANSALVGKQVIAAQGTTWSTNTSVTFTPTSSVDKVMLYLKNTQTTALARRAAVQMASITININGSTSDDSWGRPYVSMGSEQTINFDMDTIIANTTTNESIRIIRPSVATGQVVEVNTLLKSVYYRADNSNAFPNLQRYPARDEWLKLLQGANVLTCSQDGIDIVIAWQGRNNSFG